MELISAKKIGYCKGVYPMSDPLTLVNRLFTGYFFRDRFDFLNKWSPFKIKAGVDRDTAYFLATKDEPAEKITDLLDKKACELIATGKPLYVLWSGGVDSTAVVVSLLKNGAKTDQLKIISTMDNTEYPWMTEYLKKLGVELIENDRLIDVVNRLGDCKVVSGWCADQLFGSNIHMRNHTWYHLPWISGLRAAMSDRMILLSSKSYDKLEDIFGEYAQTLGLKLSQFCEFAWLVNFGCKWTYVSEETQLSVDSEASRTKVVPFYAGVDFQRWSYQNYEELSKYNPYTAPKYYKRPLKEYIYNYLNDDNYFVRKGKRNSWAMVIDNTYRDITVHDTNGWKRFTLATHYSDFCELSKQVAKKYLKEEYLD